MTAVEYRQQIKDSLNQLSDEELRLVANFISSLVQKESQQENSLLRQTQTWQGEDFEECLQAVYQTRSRIQT